MNLKSLTALPFSLLLAILTSAAQALPEDEQQELVIRSQQAEMDRRTGVVIYQGNVILTQGTLKIEADRLEILHEGNVLKSAVADGKPARYQQQINVGKPVTYANGKRIEYLSDQREVIITGDANLKQGGDQFSGQRLTYDMNAETVKANGGTSTVKEGEEKPEDSRVRMVIQPKKDDNATESSGNNTEPSGNSTEQSGSSQ